MQDLTIAFIQSELVWEDPKRNRVNFKQKIDTISKAVDLIILPEMFATGFTMQPEKVAESSNGATVKWMQQMAISKNCAITGSLAIKENDKYYNRLFFVKPSNTIETYDKRHLFTLAGENKPYTEGQEKLIVDYKGWKICPLICYDLRFPVWSRNAEEYDVLLYVANWPEKRVTAWDALLKARAIENMSYCIGVNRVGLDANDYQYVGHSAVYDSLGNQISNDFTGKEKTEIITLSSKHLEQTREKLQFLNDRDGFTIN